MGRLRFARKFESLLHGATLCAGFDPQVRAEFESLPEGTIVTLILKNRKNEDEHYSYQKESSTFRRIDRSLGKVGGIRLYGVDPPSYEDFIHSRTTIDHMIAGRQLLFEGEGPLLMAFLRMSRNCLAYMMGLGKAKLVAPNLRIPNHYLHGRSRYLVTRIIRKGAIR